MFVARGRPRRGGRPKSDAVKDRIFALYAEGFTSCRALSAEFNRRYAHLGEYVSKSTVKNWLQRYSERAVAIRAVTRNRIPHPIDANKRWALDCTGKADAQGTQHCILGIIDHATRLALSMAVVERPSACAILAKLFEAIDRFGKPECLRTDNAAVFHSALFRAVLAAVGIRHEFTERHCPWQNGRIERLFLTLKQKLDQVIPRNRAALEAMLGEFTLWYNEIRPHQHLDWHTPAEVWRGIDPFRTAPKEVIPFRGWNGMLRGTYLRR